MHVTEFLVFYVNHFKISYKSWSMKSKIISFDSQKKKVEQTFEITTGHPCVEWTCLEASTLPECSQVRYMHIILQLLLQPFKAIYWQC